MRIVKLLTKAAAMVAGTAGAATVFGQSLLMVPPTPYVGTLPQPLHVNSEARAITPDGRYVVGNSSTTGQTPTGLVWDTVSQPAASNRFIAGGYPKSATGVAYRTYNGQEQLAVFGLQDYGLGNNTPSIGITTDGGATWTNAWRDGTNHANSIMGAANTLASGGADVLWASYGKNGQFRMSVGKASGAAPFNATIQVDNKNEATAVSVNSVTNQGLTVGSRRDANNLRENYYNQWIGNGTGTAGTFNGLAGNLEGEAFAAAGDGTTGKIFGRSPIVPGGAALYPYMHDLATGITTQLPMFGDEAGSNSLSVPYGASENGRYVAGMLYRGMEKAVLWDTQLNTVVDLTDFATSQGILGNFIRLTRGYSVGINALGQPVVAGAGAYNDNGSTYTRGFVLTIPEPATLSLLVLGALPLMRRRQR